ncbi:hypothetical protein BH23VER1_BH23VER1_07890 [soil metagenome]
MTPLRRLLHLPCAPLAAFLVAAASAVASANVVINEIMFHPPHPAGTPEDIRLEFIELHNTGAAAVDLGGWAFTRGVALSFPAMVIPPGGFVVAAADPAAFATAYPGVSAPVVGGWTGRLSNRGETLELSDSAGTRVASVRYSDEGEWAQRRRGFPDRGHLGWRWEAPADGAGSSLELVNPALPNGRGQNWRPSDPVGGTPGIPNSVATSDGSPLVLDVLHSPAVPRPGDAITVAATLFDEGPLAALTVDLRWRVSTTSPEPFQALTMTDGGGGRFSATIPPQPLGTVVEFYVSALDAASNLRTWPPPTDAAGTQGANAHFQVDDEEDSIAEGFYRLIMTAAENAEFTGISRGSNAEMHTTFVARSASGHTIRYRCGTRIRGASSRGDNPPPLRLNIPSDTPWNDRVALNLNTQFTWLQFIGNKLFLDARLPAPQAKRVQVRRNGINRATGALEQFGSYVDLEPIGSEFVDRHFPEDDGGNVYKKVRPDNDWRYLAGNVAGYQSDGWLKRSNRSAADWSDLDHFLDVMNNAPGSSDYLDQVAAVADIDQWMRWFGVMTLLGNGETNLSNGADDDYSIYFGELEPRMKIIPHDLDTILSFGDGSRITDPQRTIFDMSSAGASLAPLVPFFAQGEIRQRYFDALDDLMRTTFSAGRFDPIIRNGLGDWIPPATVDAIISWMDLRRAYVQSVIHRPLTAFSGLPTQGGIPRTTSSTTSLSGTADQTLTSEIRVSGLTANFDLASGNWSANNVPLSPGINRVTVEVIGRDGSVADTTSIDIWYDDGDTVPLVVNGGVQVIDAGGGPYLVAGMVTVPEGAHLIINPGTNLHFEAGAQLVVRGALTVLGNRYQRCRFSPPPGFSNQWLGVRFIGSYSPDNAIFSTDFIGGSDGPADGGTLDIEGSSLRVDGSSFDGGSDLAGTAPTINSLESSLEVSGSTFVRNLRGYVVSRVSVPPSGAPRIIGCMFGDTGTTGNPAVDIEGIGVARIEGCSFGSPVRLAGHAQITGSSFNDIPDPAAAVTITDGTLIAARNIIAGAWSAVSIGSNAAAIVEFSTITGISSPAAIHRSLTGSAYVANSIFDPGTTIAMVPITAGENFVGDANFVDSEGGDYRLAPGSPAAGTAPLGGDFGAFVDPSVQIGGAPESTTSSRHVTLTVGGPAVVTFSYRLNGGPWSFPTPVRADRTGTIPLPDLDDSTYTIEVRGYEFGGQPQSATASVSWTVDAAGGGPRLNEILATGSPDYIELFNSAATAFDLDGYGLTDQPGQAAARFTFAAGTTLAAGGYLVVDAGELGFGLDADGETVQLRSPAGIPIDAVTFGLQAGGFTIGRMGSAAGWELGEPSPGMPNRRAVTGPQEALVINEWLAASGYRTGGDFVELYNPSSLPVELSGLRITDDPINLPSRMVIPPLSYIAPLGFAIFESSSSSPARSLGFGLSSHHDSLALSFPDGRFIDAVNHDSERDDISRGRAPDGSDRILEFALPTPGASNLFATTTTDEFLPITASWRYEQSNTNFGPSVYTPGFDDSSWPVGTGLFFLENSALPAPKSTPINTRPPDTHYFRRHFTFAGDPALTKLVFDTVIDDAVILYLNGQEIHRSRLAPGPVTHDTPAAVRVGNATFEGPFAVPSGALLQGENVLAASLHQETNPSSSDAVFGIRIYSTTTSASDPVLPRLAALLDFLRLTEIMFHSAGGETLDYLEVYNASDAPLDLTGVRITDGVTFTFPTTTLAPGAFGLIVSDISAFETVYGTGLPVVGQYSGSLSNGGERLRIELPSPYDIRIASFEYDDRWYPSTDGDGYSLVAADINGSPAHYGDAQRWRPSALVGGSPGTSGPPTIAGPTMANGTEGTALEIRVIAGNGPESYSATGLPEGLTIDPASGIISGLPAEAGEFAVTLFVSNPSGTNSANLTLSIGLLPLPTITSPTEIRAVEGVPFTYQIEAAADPDSYGATGLPPGLAIDPDSGSIAGVPTLVGHFPVTIAASNFKGTGTATLALTVEQDFLAIALDRPELGFSTGGDAGWFLQSATTHDGSDAAQAAPISHNETASFSTTVTGPGTVSFWWSVSSDFLGDFLRFRIDGSDRQIISGDQPFVQVIEPIGEGIHTLTWAFTRDDFGDGSENTGWVDELTLGGYAGWALAIPAAGAPELRLPGADFDGDGLSNLLEYALGLSPVEHSTFSLPAPEFETGAITLTFDKPPGVTGVGYTIEGSPDLSANSWSSADIVVIEDSPERLGIAIFPGTVQFLRLRVEADLGLE